MIVFLRNVVFLARNGRGSATSADVCPELIRIFDPGYYRQQAVGLIENGGDPLTHFVEGGWRHGYDPHPLFSTSFYNRRYPDVAAAGVNPLIHFFEGGWREGRDPHPLFSTSFYNRRYPDVAAAGVNPLIHFLEDGWREGRDPHPLFSTSFYIRRRPDVAAAGINALVHFLLHGDMEGSQPHQLFDSGYYRQQALELFENDGNSLIHFVNGGWQRGRDPHPLFSMSFYNQCYPDAAAAGVNPLTHFLEDGFRHEEDPHPLFSTSYYNRRNPDVATAGINPILHYLESGSDEGRWPNEWFDPGGYDGTLNGGGRLGHFVTVGLREGRAPTRQGSRDGFFHRLTCRALLSGDPVRAIKQDRALMHLDAWNDVRSCAGAVRTLASDSLNVCTLRPAKPHVLPETRALGRLGWPAAPTMLPAHEVVQLENVIAIGGARLVLTAAGNLLHDEMADPESEHYGVKLPFVRALVRNRALVHVEVDKQPIEEGILLASDSDFNYFHWMLESLPKVELVEAANIPPHVPFLVSQTVPLTGLDALSRVVGRPIIRLRNATGYRVARLHVPSDRSRILNNYAGSVSMENDIVIDPQAIDFLRARLLSSQPSMPSRKILLTRGRRYRQLLNEERLRAALAELGFEFADMGAMGLQEQIDLMSDAAVVVAPTGAAMTNIVFAHAATRVLILVPDHPQTNPYLFTQIGSYLGMDVAFALGERAFNVTGQHGIHDDYAVDIHSVTEWITKGS